MTGVGQNGDLHSLLDSLNDLGSSMPRMAGDFEMSLNPVDPRVTSTRQASTHGSINIMVRRIVFDTQEIIDEFWVSARLTESLCDILRRQERYSNWTSIESAHNVPGPLHWNVRGHTYSETRNEVDMWKCFLFDIVIEGPIAIILYVNKGD